MQILRYLNKRHEYLSACSHVIIIIYIYIYKGCDSVLLRSCLLFINQHIVPVLFLRDVFTVVNNKK